jgi:hypothetical protein
MLERRRDAIDFTEVWGLKDFGGAFSLRLTWRTMFAGGEEEELWVWILNVTPLSQSGFVVANSRLVRSETETQKARRAGDGQGRE